MLGITFIGLQLGFVLMVAGWLMMLAFLQKHPAPADWPRAPFARWSRFMKGEGFPPEAISFIAFFAAGGPDALPPPPR